MNFFPEKITGYLKNIRNLEKNGFSVSSVDIIKEIDIMKSAYKKELSGLKLTIIPQTTLKDSNSSLLEGSADFSQKK